MRGWRPKYSALSSEERKKDIARSYAGVYKRRGKLIPIACEACGTAETQMHHADYNYPLVVTWLCVPCHAIEHETTP